MGDKVSDYGPLGVSVAKRATELHALKVLTDSEFTELTNGTFGRGDYKAASAAIGRVHNYAELANAKALDNEVQALRRVLPWNPNEPPIGLGEAFGGLFDAMFK